MLNSVESEQSLQSSYADVFETSGVIIRDCEVSCCRGSTVANAVTYNLNKCKSKVIVPYYKLLSIIAWRSFGKASQCPPWYINFTNFIYTFFCFCVLFFWYYIRVKTCQGHLNIDTKPLVTLTPPVHSTVVVPTAASPHPATETYLPLLYIYTEEQMQNSSHNNEMGNVCQHLIGTYIIPNLLHFLAFIIGFYHFRVQEHEGLYALMEKVYLQSSYPGKMTRTLRMFLLGGFLWLCLCVGNSIFYFYAYGIKSGTKMWGPKYLVYAMSALIVFAGLFSNCVYMAVILSYCGQCQLLQYYISGVKDRLEEKSTELKTAMKDVLDIKCHFSRLNGMLSLSMSCLVFDLFITVIITSIMLFNYKSMGLMVWLYRFSVFVQYGSILLFLLYQAALLTCRGSRLYEEALAIRVFGYQAHSNIEIDSFLGFLHKVKLEVEIFAIPIKPCYLCGFLIFSVQALIISFQTGFIVNKSKWL